MTFPSSAPFGAMVQGRGLRMNIQVKRRVDGGDPVGWDLTADADEVRLRAWKKGEAALVLDELMTKSDTGKGEGFVDHWHSCGAAAQPTLLWEIVVVETAIPAAGTVSTKQETTIASWLQPVEAAATQPVPNP